MAATKAKGDSGGEIDLRQRRREAGLSQQRLAELAGCSLAAVALYERGYRPEHSGVLPRIVSVLNDESPKAATSGSRETSGDGVAGHVPG